MKKEAEKIEFPRLWDLNIYNISTEQFGADVILYYFVKKMLKLLHGKKKYPTFATL